MTNRLLLLGTGASMGVPVIGCSCAVCTSSDPKNRRLRTSALLEWEGRRFLIDAGPDFRQQALTHKIDRLDGCLFTHTHYDHIGGIDELRVFFLLQHKPLPCLLSASSRGDLERRFAHLFTEPAPGINLAAQLAFQTLEGERGSATFEGLPLTYFTYLQGGMPVTGYRIGPLAYVTDIARYPETIFEDLQGVRVLILSALRTQPTPIHFTVEEAVQFAQRSGAEKTYLVHTAHELDYAQTEKGLPKGVSMGFDGLEIRL
ncbi:MAG: MBL fold metallo-hydrolase [Parachlamydiales bacterium]